jgi:copper chaperone
MNAIQIEFDPSAYLTRSSHPYLTDGVAMSTFKVPDMTCGHCVKSITTAIKDAAPSVDVECDLTTKVVTITGPHDPDKIKGVIQEAGYSPEAA